MTPTAGHTPNSKRSATRDSMLLIAELRRLSADGSLGESIGPARVRNLSATGLMAECAGRLQAGELVSLELHGVGTITAHVRWVRDGRIGLTFEKPIDSMTVRRPISTKASSSQPAYPPPSFSTPRIR